MTQRRQTNVKSICASATGEDLAVKGSDTMDKWDRRSFLQISTAAAAGAMATAIQSQSKSMPSRTAAAGKRQKRKPVKAFSIDFNWGDHGAAEPGLFAQADPQEHVRWYQELGTNTIQTFCVTYNGYAWYPSEVAPITPGLKNPNFLGEMVKRGHQAGLKVMGYFTLGANPYWEQRHPEIVHGTDSDYIKIPFTLEYLDYFCRSVEDALKKVQVL